MKVGDLMSKQVVKVTAVTMLPEVAKKMREENVGILPVEENGKVIGMVTDRDITIQAVAKGDIQCQVKDVMSRHLEKVSSETPVKDALKTMLDKRVRRLAVMDGENLKGLLSFEDLARAGGDEHLIVDALKKFNEQTRHE